MAAKLVLLNQPRCLPVGTFNLPDGRFTCGRSSTCQFRVPHPSVSRLHAELAVVAGRVTVVDLDSHNHTFVDGVRVSTAKLELGQTLRLGTVVSFVLAYTPPDDGGNESAIETADGLDGPMMAASDPPALALTAAQGVVLELALRGLAEKQIARRLRISPKTVHNHLCEIYRALGVHSRTELLARLLGGSEG